MTGGAAQLHPTLIGRRARVKGHVHARPARAREPQVPTTPSDPPALLSRHADVAVLTLNRPDGANALNLDMILALAERVEDLHREGWARAVVLRAEGRIFCGGGDVVGFAGFCKRGDAAGLSAHLREVTRQLHQAQTRLTALGVPVIAAVNGAAAGAGMSLVLAADFAYAGPRARLTPAYAAIGFSADGGMSWLLPRLVGQRRAAEIMLTNRTIGAAEAASLGLVNEALADDETFEIDVLHKAEALARGSRPAMAATLRLLREAGARSLPDQLEAESRSMAELALGPDVAEGLTALRQKRPPSFGA
jgi:2-(1,2-epoxy-1,2-dihydrophenyl)acetyl-CoA isomerase